MNINHFFSTALFCLAAGVVSAQQTLDLRVVSDTKYQTIQNFGASACWFGEPIGKNWPLEKKSRIAELLFSTDTLENGTPKGIGLTAFRFNIGAGTAEQGDSSGIVEPNHRVECFLDENGKYDWKKQAGYQWFLQQAKAYKVPDLIAFVNSPPVFYNQNHLGFLLTKGHDTNLSSDHIDDFSKFLTTVIKHFDKEGLHFNYISPVNEPQWDWFGEFGKAKQEGTPYTNEEMYAVIQSLNKQLVKTKSKTQILTTEAAMLTYLTQGSGVSSSQIEHFWNPASKLYLGNCSTLARYAGGHSYFTDGGDENLIKVRQKVDSSVTARDITYWQTEYCLLGDGYKDGTGSSRSTLDCGLFLAKIIHYDLTAGNASAWHYWNAFEPGRGDVDTRYYLFAIQPNQDWTDGEFATTGNLFALGHYSRFVRPGMQRVALERSDKATLLDEATTLMASAYEDPKTHQQVLVLINYSEEPYTLHIQSGKNQRTYKQYVTDKDRNLTYAGKASGKTIEMTPRSIYTLVSE